MNYQAVLFDFDYTLGDATDAIVAGYTHGLTALGWPPPDREAVRRTVGRTLEDGYTDLTGDASQERQGQFRDLFTQVAQPIQAAGTPLCTGAPELLRGLNALGVPVGVVSTKRTQTLDAIFNQHGLREALALVIGGDQVKASKPDPEGLFQAFERLRQDPGKVLYCGDTVIDAGAARAAGCDFCAVLNGVTPREAFTPFPCVHTAPNLGELKIWLGA